MAGLLPADLPIVDHHCHLSPTGEGVEAARRFRAAGGTHLFLCTQSYGPSPPRTVEGYREQFEITERLGRRVREETGAVVHLVVAPFPVDLVGQVPTMGRPAAVELHREALQLAGRWVRDRRAVALGEVGRPHFPVDEEVRAAAEEVLREAMRSAREAHCPIVVHSEDLDPPAFRALADLAREEGLGPSQVVKHYARKALSLAERSGLPASYVARQETFDRALEGEAPYFFETDFLDDPGRPGAVLDLGTIPKRARAAYAKDPGVSERLRVPFVESVERVYGVRPEPVGAGP